MTHTVLKIGGSSIADAQRFRQAAEVVRSDPMRRYVVTSALGKRDAADVKVTVLLRSLQTTPHREDTLRAIEQRHLQIVTDLSLGEDAARDVRATMQAIERRLAEPNRKAGPYIESRGEFLSARLFAHYLGWDFADARGLIRLTSDGSYDEDATRSLPGWGALPERAIIPGYYGTDRRGSIRVFPLGGSDISGAIVAANTGAALYENGTDVPGVYRVSPKILPERAQELGVIPRLTYVLMQELAHGGAGVLHYKAAQPVREAGIPTRIFTMQQPELPGTCVYPDDDGRGSERAGILGIAERSGFMAFTIRKPGFNAVAGITVRALGILHEIEHVATGVDTVSIIVHEERLGRDPTLIARAFEQKLGVHVDITQNMSVVCLVGRGFGSETVLPWEARLAERGIRRMFFEQGMGGTTLVVGVASVRLRETVEAFAGFLSE